ncbi:hypothetical protein BZG36_01876 [Bifiguratus adelaidae]|uniref:SAM-dependent methyltransferase n=1 Tax=Bifiguratus adelaidae TaxID=1938954 RepID=A0A261Y2E5_9FUNG|nr:hypothetical protein BZG36_01876 [Bifiguratus adelaidae]
MADPVSLQRYYGVEIPRDKDRIVFAWTERNKNPILKQLQAVWSPAPAHVLEISSGSGQHVAYFASHFPSTTFHPTEYVPSFFSSIRAYSYPLSNITPPQKLDVASDDWSRLTPQHFDAMLVVNLCHIAPWHVSEGLLKGVSKHLNGGYLLIYGPFKRNGAFTSESNEEFDRDLKRRNHAWGLRDTDDIQQLASQYNLVLDKVLDMPSNNFMLWIRKA